MGEFEIFCLKDVLKEVSRLGARTARQDQQADVIH